MDKGSICLVPVINSLAGPGSFQLKLKTSLERRGYKVHHTPSETGTSAILIIAGTRHVGKIWAAKQNGVRIVQRLNGINWVHRQRSLGVRYFLRAEIANLLLTFTRRFLADHVIYQSQFTFNWWQDWYGKTGKTPHSIIHNGVDLNAYSPIGTEVRPTDHIRVQVVEGHLNLDNGMALDNAWTFSRTLEKAAGQAVELVVLADVHPFLQSKYHNLAADGQLTFAGAVPRDQIPSFSRSAHMLYSAEINGSCPNSVVEALACGLPVAAFDTGALPELVTGDAGRVVPFGADPWKLEPPDFHTLAQASLKIIAEQQHFRREARALAEVNLGLERMTDHYLADLIR